VDLAQRGPSLRRCSFPWRWDEEITNEEKLASDRLSLSEQITANKSRADELASLRRFGLSSGPLDRRNTMIIEPSTDYPYVTPKIPLTIEGKEKSTSRVNCQF
jgi:hypothetical protein